MSVKTIIMGDYTKWNKAVALLERYRPDIIVIGCCDPYRDQLSGLFAAAYSMQETGDKYFKGEIDGVIVIDASKRELNDFLNKCDIKNYAIPTKYYFMDSIDEQEIQTIVRPYGDIPAELSQIEFHLADHCNLNCAGCAHFSNIVPKPVFADYEQFVRDLTRLNELFEFISEFYLLGGEPLLNKDIDIFMQELRKQMPHTQIIVVTNGLLVLQIKNELLDVFKNTKSRLSISNYNCLDTEKIKKFLDDSGIDYEIRYGRDYFAKYLTESNDGDINDIFDKCPNRRCHFLGKGEIAVCGQPFYIKYFNEYFNEKFSDRGAISLYDETDGNTILEKMSKPMETCRNCTYLVPTEWKVTDKVALKSDWIAR